MTITRRDFGRYLGALGIGGFAISEIGCGGATVASILDSIIATAGEILDVGFPQYASLLAPYEQQLQTFVDAVTAELATSDTVAMKFAVISAAAAKVVAPDLTGLPAEIVTRIQGIAPLIASLVSLIGQLEAAIGQTPGGANAFFAAHKSVKAPTAEQLDKIRTKNAQLKMKLAQKTPKKTSWGPRPEYDFRFERGWMGVDGKRHYVTGDV